MEEDHAAFSRAAARYVNSEPFSWRPIAEQQAIRRALQQARTRDELPEDVRQDMQDAGF